MVVMVIKQKGFINPSILETLKNSPDTRPSLKFLEQRVHELVREGVHDPP